MDCTLPGSSVHVDSAGLITVTKINSFLNFQIFLKLIVILRVNKLLVKLNNKEETTNIQYQKSIKKNSLYST